MKLSKNKAQWFTKLKKEIEKTPVAAERIYRETNLRNELEYIKDSIRVARRYFTGFESKDGWDLRRVDKIPLREIEKVKAIRRDYVQMANEPHKLIRPKTKAAKEALVAYTGQDPKQKAYIVMKPMGSKVKLVQKTVKPKKGKPKTSTSVQVSRKVDGGTIVERTFLFSDFTDKPIITYEDAERALKKMMPHLPKGHYVVVSRLHGNIVSHATKNKLMDYFADTFYTYKSVMPGEKDNRGVFQDLVGVRLTGFNQLDADKEYVERTSRREQMRRNREKLRSRKRRQVSERIRRRYK